MAGISYFVRFVWFVWFVLMSRKFAKAIRCSINLTLHYLWLISYQSLSPKTPALSTVQKSYA